MILANMYNCDVGATITGTSEADFIMNDDAEGAYGNAGSSVLVYGAEGDDTIGNGNENSDGGDYVTMFGGAGNDIIKNLNYHDGACGNSASVMISGDDGNDSIDNEYGNEVTIFGGAGNDSIANYGGYKVTITGGADNDTILNSGGSVFIKYYNGDGDDTVIGFSSTDTLQILNNSYTVEKSGNDLKVKVGSGSILLKNVSNAQIQGTYDNSTLPLGLSIRSVVLTASTKFTGNKINLTDYAPIVTKVNASALTSGVSIIGSSANNSLTGGKGNDVLTGGAGKDVFVYASGDGNDTITDYTAGQDKIKIKSGTISSCSFSGKNVIFNIGSGSITVKNGKGKKITIIDANNKTTTKTYTNLASSADLLDDDNFISSSARIDDISGVTSDNYSVSEIKTFNYETLAQDKEIYIAHAEK